MPPSSGGRPRGPRKRRVVTYVTLATYAKLAEEKDARGCSLTSIIQDVLDTQYEHSEELRILRLRCEALESEWHEARKANRLLDSRVLKLERANRSMQKRLHGAWMR